MSGPAPAPMNPPTVTSPRWSRRRSCVRSVPQARRRALLPPRRAFRSRTSPSTRRWPSPPFITGRTRSPACARCGAWLAAWWCSRATQVSGAGVAGSGSLVTTSPRSLLPVSASLPSWPARSERGWSRCSFRGTALTASSRPTGAGPRRTWTSTSVAEYRCGRNVGPDAEQRAVRSLRRDLASGRWAERNRDLLDLEAAELGLRLLIA